MRDGREEAFLGSCGLLLFRIELAQLFVGVALSDSPVACWASSVHFFICLGDGEREMLC